MIEVQQPRGDSYGTLGETVVARQLKARPLRNLRQRQLALLVLCLGHAVILLDGAVVNVALPSIQRELGFSQSNLVWVVNAYLIPFGGLLLFAGRLGDLVGPKRVFLAGLTLFTSASVLCGLASSQAMLIGARFLQGVGGALASAVVLGMIITMFPKPLEQARALGFYAFVAASGAAVGLLVGALLTESLSWHWIFFVNVPIGLATAAYGSRTLFGEREEDQPPRADVVGAVLIVTSLMLSVYTIVQAVNHGWTSQRTIGLAGVALVLLAAFVGWQTRARNPLVPLRVLRARNVAWTNVVLALMVAGPTGMFFLGALYLQQVQGFSVIEVGLSFLPVAVVIGLATLKVTPRLIRHVDPKTVLISGLLVMAVGLALFARIPVHSQYLIDLLPAMALLGVGTGLAIPSALTVALASATASDTGVRSGLVSTTQQLGSALGLAILATVSASSTTRAMRHGHPLALALTSGYKMAFLVGAGIVLGALVLALVAVKPAVPKTAPNALDPTLRDASIHREDLTGVVDPDFLALGLGGMNMMSMLWSVAMGRRAVGVELRGDPVVAVMHWNIREDLYHHLALIDQLMAERYGEDRIPRRGDGTIFRLHECFYGHDPESAGDARADEVISGYIEDSHIAGVVDSVELIDDRWVDGEPARSVTTLGPAKPSTEHDPSWIGRSMVDVLSERSAFQVGAQEVLILMRRYLQAMERMDLASGVEPRCRLFTYHRVVAPERDRRSWLSHLFSGRQSEAHGFVDAPDGRKRIRIEAIREMEGKRSYRRVRRPGTEVIDLGIPELFSVAEGLDSSDAERLGFKSEAVTIDHHDGRGPVIAQADYLIGLMTMYIGNHCRRRITSEFDKEGNEYWVRQIAIGHEEDAEIGWIVAEVPDFRTFDPILAGVVPAGTDQGSAQFYAGYQHLLKEYYVEQVRVLTEIPRSEIVRISIASTPTLFSVVSRIGVDARVATNGVVAGDSFGNGSFLMSEGFNTGAIGHAARVLRYWQGRDTGCSAEESIRRLADGIKEDTQGWLQVTEAEFRQPPLADHRDGKPRDRVAIEKVLDATRRHRQSIAPVNHRDHWSRITLFVGRLHSHALAPLLPTHPDLRPPEGSGPNPSASLVSVGSVDGGAGTRASDQSEPMPELAEVP